jgi:hypothetical protein
LPVVQEGMNEHIILFAKILEERQLGTPKRRNISCGDTKWMGVAQDRVQSEGEFMLGLPKLQVVLLYRYLCSNIDMFSTWF